MRSRTKGATRGPLLLLTTKIRLHGDGVLNGCWKMIVDGRWELSKSQGFWTELHLRFVRQFLLRDYTQTKSDTPLYVVVGIFVTGWDKQSFVAESHTTAVS